MKHIGPIIMLGLLALMTGCIPKNAGEVTLVNSDIKTAKVAIDQRSFTIFASNHITKPIADGLHRITLNRADKYEISVLRDKTTLFDTTGLSCFAVIDFTPAYSGASVSVVEKFFRQRTFTTTSKMSAVLGGHLPKNIKGGEKILQLTQIDCEIFDDDEAIALETQPNK